MSNWHVGKNKFALTSTIHITTHNTKVANDKEWLTQKVSHSKMARLQNHAEDNSILTGKPQNMRRQMHHMMPAKFRCLPVPQDGNADAGEFIRHPALISLF